jgi:hypothetical protein
MLRIPVVRGAGLRLHCQLFAFEVEVARQRVAVRVEAGQR